jgi:uncharacterized repeat protein (TIGR01451 family)
MDTRYPAWRSSVLTRNRALWAALTLASVLTLLLVLGLATASATVSASAPVPKLDGAALPLASSTEPQMGGGTLDYSRKTASQMYLAPGQVLTYTIWLHNSSYDDVVAQVVDPLPSEVHYVAESVTGGGVYDPVSRKISWTNVTVPARDNRTGHVALSFAVTATVDAKISVVNTAIISSGGESFERSVWVKLVPEPEPRPLDGFKLASQSMLAPGEVLTYTVILCNRNTTTTTADVSDPLPQAVNYVSGSVTSNGVYDSDSRTISWNDVTVPPAHFGPTDGWWPMPICDPVRLSFAVTATADAAGVVVNTATISAEERSFERSAWVWLIPYRPTPGRSLAGSRKIASQYLLAPDEVLTYTIWLRNSDSDDVVADVTDPIPAELNYVAGSATEGGAYDPTSRTISWDDVTVPGECNSTEKEGVKLSFAVTGMVDFPTKVANTAVISAQGKAFERTAWIKLVPERPSPKPPVLDGSKLASQHMLAPHEVLTYTILLHNRSDTIVTADVVDPLPRELNYVAGSATDGGVYDPASRTISWSNVAVPEPGGTARCPRPGGYTRLSFAVTATVDVRTEVFNTAIISAEGRAFERSVWVLLVPERPLPKPDLRGSFKWASHRKLTSGESLYYSIKLHNSGTAEGVADVVDQLPAEVEYVPGSAVPEAVYDGDTHTLHWQNVEIPQGWGKSLFFAAASEVVSVPTLITNTAIISADGASLERYARTLLLPEPPERDHIPPMVHSLTVDEQDVLTSPTVTLHISATDNVEVHRMYVREWAWAATPWPRWRTVQSSGWVTYQADYSWTLRGESGTHFVGVWVADKGRNISRLSLHSLDFASLLLPGAAVPESGMTPYLVYYGAGVDVSATLTPTTSTAQVAMNVWYARNFFEPIARNTQEVTFTTPSTGTYVFVVHGESGVTYDLSIEPGGGPRLPLVDERPRRRWPHVSAADQAAPDEASDLVSMLTTSGLDPLSIVDAPSMVSVVYLPVVLK